MDILAMVKARRNDILKIAADHGARNVRLFGSVARGEADADSDVDLLVEFGAERSLMDHAALQVELEDLIGRPVDVITEHGLRPSIRARILVEAVRL